MSWGALVAREVREQLRPAGRMTGAMFAGFGTGFLFAVGAVLVTALVVQDGMQLGVGFRAMSAAAAGAAGAAIAGAILPLNVGVDAIAGERERHTLGTLLATPLDDLQILTAKAAAIVAVSLAVSAVGGAAAWVVVAVLYGLPGLAWGALALPAAVVLALLPAFVFCSWAFVFSVRARTVRDAAQKLAFIILPFILVPQAAILADDSLAPGTAVVVFLAIGTALLAFTVLGPVLAVVRFRRERLVA